jgi:hypothetical protein
VTNGSGCVSGRPRNIQHPDPAFYREHPSIVITLKVTLLHFYLSFFPFPFLLQRGVKLKKFNCANLTATGSGSLRFGIRKTNNILYYVINLWCLKREEIFIYSLSKPMHKRLNAVLIAMRNYRGYGTFHIINKILPCTVPRYVM